MDDGDRFTRDDMGLDLKDFAAARRDALAALPDIARGVIFDGDRRDVVVTVREGLEHKVFRATLSLVAEYLS